MNIFELSNFQVTFSPQALMLKPFREIWDADVSEDKYTANAELAYVYYMCDDRSDYQYELDDDTRHDNIIAELEGLDENWIKPDYIDKAMDYYKRMSETTSTMLLRSARRFVQKISKMLDDIDPNERDPRTRKPIFNIDKMIASVEKVPKAVKALNDTEQEVIKEKALKAQSGNRDAGVFDDEGI